MSEMQDIGHVDGTVVVKELQWCTTMASPPDTSVTSTSFCEDGGTMNHHFSAENQTSLNDDNDAEVTSSSEIASFTDCCISLPLESHADEVNAVQFLLHFFP
jgi:hypothetical protein